MEIISNERLFKFYFEKYLSKLDELKELTEEDFPRSLRLFDIRFRLALSLQISFDNSISYTKTETTRKTYRLILKLNDLWFAYEGLYKLLQEGNYLRSNPTKSDPFTQERIEEFELDECIDFFNDYLDAHFYTNPRRKNDTESYIQHLIDHSTGRTQPLLLENLKNNIQQEFEAPFNQILALIYAIRNMYVHNADSARTGVKQYQTKIELLKNCIDFLIISILKISVFIINERVENIE